MLLNTQRCMYKIVNCHLIMWWGGGILLNRTWSCTRCSLSLGLLLEAWKNFKGKSNVTYHLLIWVLTVNFIHSLCDIKQVFWFCIYQRCALAVPRCSWHLMFAPRQLGNLSFCIEITCWAPWISQVQKTRLPIVFLRARPCFKVKDIFSWILQYITQS